MMRDHANRIECRHAKSETTRRIVEQPPSKEENFPDFDISSFATSDKNENVAIAEASRLLI